MSKIIFERSQHTYNYILSIQQLRLFNYVQDNFIRNISCLKPAFLLSDLYPYWTPYKHLETWKQKRQSLYGRQTQIPTRMNTKSPIMNWKMPSMVIVAVSTLQIHLFHCLVYNLVAIIQYQSVLLQDLLMNHKKWNPPNVPSIN